MTYSDRQGENTEELDLNINTKNSLFAMLFIMFGKVVAVTFALSLWCTVIFAIWIAVICREVLVFGLKSAVLSFKTNKTPSLANIERAMTIWPAGFMRILMVLFNDNHNVSDTHENIFIEMSASHLVVEVFWAVIFYIITLYIVVNTVFR
jgi:hypothetical protein